MSVISTHELSKSFRHTHAVEKLNLEIEEGSIFALVGPNGAGKTTTIKTLMNILRPSAGSAEVLGTNSRRLGPAEFTQIGYVSENQELPLWMTVDYLMSWLRPFSPAWDNAWAEELLRQLDLPRGRRLRELSRGMRIKAALASSLAYHPKLIVLDEPFAGLDSLVRDELIEALLERCASATVMISRKSKPSRVTLVILTAGACAFPRRCLRSWRVSARSRSRLTSRRRCPHHGRRCGSIRP